MAALISKFSNPTIEASSRRSRQRFRGFALISTLLLMVLLGLITVGLLGLSTVTMRTASREAARAEAQANARMALMLAIGQLQRDTGPDMRVTAPASIINGDSASSSNELSLTGVWKSWEGSDHTATGAAAGRPIAPDYASKRLPGYSSSGRFLSWLVSKPYGVSDDSLISDDPNWSLSDALQNIVSNVPFEGSIPLVSSGSLRSDDARQVHVAPVFIDRGESQRGAYAWWVSGENQKARLPLPHKPTDDSDAAGWSMLAKSHSVADPSALDLDVLLAADGSNKAAKIISLNTSSLLVPRDPNTPDPAEQFHDMSVWSVGLMTNTATGGWRKDLSLFTENWNNLPASGVEVFRITPDATATITRPTVADCSVANVANPSSAFFTQKSLFYPWSTYRLQNPSPTLANARTSNMGAHHGAVASWHNLMDYATLYKKLTLQNGKPTMNSILDGSYTRYKPIAVMPFEQNVFDYLHKVRVIPALGRLHVVYSYRSIPSPTAPGKYKVQLGVTPLGTIWNPYNVNLTLFQHSHLFDRSLPPAFRFRIGSHYSDTSWSFVPGNNDNYNTSRPGEIWTKLNYNTVWVRGPNGITLTPGETKLGNINNLGYDPASLSTYTRYSNITINGVSDFDASDQISLTTRFDSFGGGANKVGAFFEMRDDRPPTQSLANILRYGIGHTFYSEATANQFWPRMNEIDLPSHPVSAMTGNGVPFLSLMFGPRLSSGSVLPTRGVHQNNPLGTVNFCGQGFEMGTDSVLDLRGQIMTQGARGAANPVNAAMDFNFITHSSWLMDNLPNCSQDGRNNGYLISGTQSGDGLKRVVVAELPLRPLGSLAELQHWDLRKDNPAPPRQFNIIANSDAQPLFSPNAVIRNGTGIPDAAPNPSIDLQHDDSYCANHLLFDDWFFSTIAPQPTTFGSTGKTLQETFTAWVSEGKPLDNRAYRPILADSGISSSQATELFNAKVNTADAYRTIASRLEVDGMFNVNSTSVKAWRALLGHARNQRMPYYDNNGNVVLSDPTDYAVSRTTVASDVAAGKNGSSGSFPGASEYSGYRVFTDEMLDQFADEMVNQVRKRGPFLSLSEFVNRQLSVEKNLALAGAVQSALNVLAANTDDKLNPYSFLQGDSQDAGRSVLVAKGQDTRSGFDKFPEASEGKSAYGLPGWPRQADILRPLAPILSARDDTFTIRAYGDARDPNGKIIARATCEAIVRRGREFVSSENEPDTLSGLSDTNERFGRRYHIISFRWLNADEI
ncbi:MAG: hypothetical protein ACK40T_09990 [Akkermansiaceae bacterium]|jgi:Tfp pilus assembly protein PilV